MATKEEMEKFRNYYEKHKKTPEGMKAQKRKAAYQKKMTGSQAMHIDESGKITGIHHHRAKKHKMKHSKEDLHAAHKHMHEHMR